MAKKPDVNAPLTDDPSMLSVEETEAQMIQKYYYRFRRAQNALGDKHKTWEEIDQFDRGEQWKDAVVPPWVVKPITNYIRYTRTIKRANLASAISRPTFHAEDPQDAQTVDMLQHAHDHVWDRQHVERTTRRCIDRSLLYGTQIVYVYSDEQYTGGKYFGEYDPNNPDDRAWKDNSLYQGDIRVTRFPITNFFPDPDAWDIEDCKYIETTEILPVQEVQRNPLFVEYTKKQGTYDKLKNLVSDQLDREDEASGTIFERDYSPTDNGLTNLHGDYLLTLHTHWERYLNEDGKWQLDVTYYLRNTDFALLRLEDVQPNVYPFAVYRDEEEEQDFWGTSTAMDILPNQKVINKTAQTAGIIATLHQNPQKIVLRESGINAQEMSRTGTLPGKVWVSNVPGEQAVSTIKPADIPKGLFETEDRMKADIREMAGTNEAYTGGSVGSLTTSTGVNDLIERATVRDKDKMIQIDAFVESISNLIVLFIIHKWDMPRPLVRTNGDGRPDYGQFNPIDGLTAENLEWRVRSNVYAKAPVTQSARRQQATQLIQWQGQYGFSPALITPQELLRYMEFPDTQDILARMDQDQQMMQQQQQAQAPAKILDQLLAQAGLKVTASSNEPSAIMNMMQALNQMAQEMANNQNALNASHAGNSLNMLPEGGAGNTADAPNAPQGTTGANQLSAMLSGQGGTK